METPNAEMSLSLRWEMLVSVYVSISMETQNAEMSLNLSGKCWYQ
jgi:hypothetical protein